MRHFNCLDLTKCINNCGSTNLENSSLGQFTIAGSSFPAEELPFNDIFVFDDIPFYFVKQEHSDNVVPEGQTIVFPDSMISKIHILGASSEGNMRDNLLIQYNSNELIKSSFHLSEFTGMNPFSQNQLAIQMSRIHTIGKMLDYIHPVLWYDVIDLSSRPILANSFLFSDNPCVHIFSLTIEEVLS
ncbi:MAG: hypothetical protein ACQEXX_31630 [Bacillota bacterium]